MHIFSRFTGFERYFAHLKAAVLLWGQVLAQKMCGKVGMKDLNPAFLGESYTSDPPLNPDLHHSWHFVTMETM